MRVIHRFILPAVYILLGGCDGGSTLTQEAPTLDHGMSAPNDFRSGDASSRDAESPLLSSDADILDAWAPDGGPSVSLTPGHHEFALDTEDGRTRRYLVYVPSTVVQEPAVVMVLHGGGGSADGAKSDYGFDATADANGFIVVYPEGIPAPVPLGENPAATWNSGQCCGTASEVNVDDVAFFRALLADFATRHTHDESRVYATGFSNGGAMSHRLACELSDHIAAVAPVGAPYEDIACAPSRAVPILFVHGTDDRCANFDGGENCGGCFQRIIGAQDAGTYACEPVNEGVARWRTLNECGDDVAVPFENGAARCESWDCAGDTAVSFCQINGMGHHFPGTASFPFCTRPNSRQCVDAMRELGASNSDLSTVYIWDFFQAHSRP